jgi:hypothetical protein
MEKNKVIILFFLGFISGVGVSLLFLFGGFDGEHKVAEDMTVRNSVADYNSQTTFDGEKDECVNEPSGAPLVSDNRVSIKSFDMGKYIDDVFFDFEYLRENTNQHDENVEHLISEFNVTNDNKVSKIILTEMLKLMDARQIKKYTPELLASSNENERELAYTILSTTTEWVEHEALEDTLIQNSYDDERPSQLVKILSSIKTNRSEKHKTSNGDIVISRVRELARHGDKSVRAQAIKTLASIDHSEQTREDVRRVIEYGDLEEKRHALEALLGYEQLNSDERLTLSSIANDQDADLTMRMRALSTLSFFDDVHVSRD